MSQNDFNIADANGATVLVDLNAALQALASQSSGSSAPSTPYPAQPWFDTTTGLLKFRNAANNAWVTFGTIGDSSKFEAYVNNALAYDISTALVHTFAGTAAMKIPVGTSAQRPTAVQGMIRYNTTISNFESYDGSSWIVFGTPPDGSITFVKMATTAIATISEAFSGTASKLIDAATLLLVNSSVLWVREQQSSGVAGGTFTSGAWQTRVLNTIGDNGISGASLASNQITLPAGKYVIEAILPTLNTNSSQGRLQNITDGTTTILGKSEVTGVTAGGNAYVRGTFSIASTKTFEIQHRCTTTRATDGFGFPSSLGTEVYSEVIIRKIR